MPRHVDNGRGGESSSKPTPTALDTSPSDSYSHLCGFVHSNPAHTFVFVCPHFQIGVDDRDVFKGIELKLQALDRLLDMHVEWRGKLVLVQVCERKCVGGEGRDV